jgi:hypothetical protein
MTNSSSGLPGIKEGPVKHPVFDSVTHSQKALKGVYNKDLIKEN